MEPASFPPTEGAPEPRGLCCRVTPHREQDGKMCRDPEIKYTLFGHSARRPPPPLSEPEDTGMTHRETPDRRFRISVILLMPLRDSEVSHCRDMLPGGEATRLVQHGPKPCPVGSLPALLQKDNVLPAHLGEVIGHGCARDSTTTDDHPRLGRQGDRMRLGS